MDEKSALREGAGELPKGQMRTSDHEQDCPFVSIVIPVYNGANYLREAIESALAQSYRMLEIIVVNDGSEDDGATERIALSYGDRIRYFSKPNGGVASALNLGIREMRGDYFSWLSHDDLYFPDKVRTQVDFIAVHKLGERAIPFSDFVRIDASGKCLELVTHADVRTEEFPYFLLATSGMHGCSLLIPRRAFEECGMFPEDEPYTQDYTLWLRISERFRFVHQGAVLVKSRQHAAQGVRSPRFVAELAKFKRREIRRFYGDGLRRVFGPDEKTVHEKAVFLAGSVKDLAPSIMDAEFRRELHLTRMDAFRYEWNKWNGPFLPQWMVDGFPTAWRSVCEERTVRRKLGRILLLLSPRILTVLWYWLKGWHADWRVFRW